MAVESITLVTVVWGGDMGRPEQCGQNEELHALRAYRDNKSQRCVLRRRPGRKRSNIIHHHHDSDTVTVTEKRSESSSRHH